MKKNKSKQENITRIKASDTSNNSSYSSVTKIKALSKEKKQVSPRSSSYVKPKSQIERQAEKIIARRERRKQAKKNGLRQDNYFKASWKELKQVRWTNRKTTWKITWAVILYSVIIACFILLLDFGFNELFKLIFK